MMIHQVTARLPAARKRKRVGRGSSAGQGKTCGRGTKGAGSRSGFSGSIRPTYEGGQTPYYRTIPKRGFSNIPFRKRFAVVNVADLEAHFPAGAEITGQLLAKVGLVSGQALPVKILASGDLTKSMTISAGAFSSAARKKIEAAGGTCKVV